MVNIKSIYFVLSAIIEVLNDNGFNSHMMHFLKGIEKVALEHSDDHSLICVQRAKLWIKMNVKKPTPKKEKLN